METTSPTRSILAAVHTDIAEAKAFRIETIQEAFQSAKESPLALTTAAKQVAAEVRAVQERNERWQAEVQAKLDRLVQALAPPAAAAAADTANK